MKHSKLLFGFITIFGIVFLILLLIGSYLDAIDSVNILASLEHSTQLGFLSLLCGTGLVTVGMIGIGRHYFKNHKKLFTVLSGVLISPLIFFSVIFTSVLVIIAAPMFPIRTEITQVTVIDPDPLVLSVDIKAITSRTSIIESAIIYNDNNTIVAQTDFGDRTRFEHKDYTGLALAVLPAGSEIIVTFIFNTALESGNYIVGLSSWGWAHDSSPFTIP